MQREIPRKKNNSNTYSLSEIPLFSSSEIFSGRIKDLAAMEFFNGELLALMVHDGEGTEVIAMSPRTKAIRPVFHTLQEFNYYHPSMNCCAVATAFLKSTNSDCAAFDEDNIIWYLYGWTEDVGAKCFWAFDLNAKTVSKVLLPADMSL